jgi:hypothetical protein
MNSGIANVFEERHLVKLGHVQHALDTWTKAIYLNKLNQQSICWMESAEFRGTRASIHVEFSNLTSANDQNISVNRMLGTNVRTCSGDGNTCFSSLRNTSVQTSLSNSLILRVISSGENLFTRCNMISTQIVKGTRDVDCFKRATHQRSSWFDGQEHS